jgi:hypothetical protein
MENQSMIINEVSNQRKLVRDVMKTIVNLSIETENAIEASDSISFRSFLDGKVAAYNHCVKMLANIEDKL